MTFAFELCYQLIESNSFSSIMKNKTVLECTNMNYSSKYINFNNFIINAHEFDRMFPPIFSLGEIEGMEDIHRKNPSVIKYLTNKEVMFKYIEGEI